MKTLPPPLPDINRESSLKILGVAFSNDLRVQASDHIRRVVSESAQTLYALRVLRHHGLSEVGLQEVFRAVVVSRLTYTSTAWRGFVTASDIQRVDAFLWCSKRCVSARRTYQTSASSWRSATTDFSTESATTRNTSCTAVCRRLPPPPRTTICDPAGI